MADDLKLMRFIRKLIETLTTFMVADGVDPAELDLGFPVYTQNAKYKTGDIRRDEQTDQPFECISDYDGAVNQNWNLSTSTVWKPFHGKDIYHAYPWVRPTGAHDQYKQGEFMTYDDGFIYEALEDTAMSPEEYPQAWKKHG